MYSTNSKIKHVTIHHHPIPFQSGPPPIHDGGQSSGHFSFDVSHLLPDYIHHFNGIPVILVLRLPLQGNHFIVVHLTKTNTRTTISHMFSEICLFLTYNFSFIVHVFVYLQMHAKTLPKTFRSNEYSLWKTLKIIMVFNQK